MTRIGKVVRIIMQMRIACHSGGNCAQLLLTYKSIKKTKAMRTPKNINKIVLIIAIFLQGAILPRTTQAQAISDGSGVNIVIEGTSNIHDWTMSSAKGTCNLTFDANAEKTISNLVFSIPVSTIKSESKAMDKNAYKALKSEQFPTITFTSSSVNVKVKENNNLVVTAKGNLTISGVTKPVLLSANATVNQNNSVTYTGSIKLKMTDFNVQPPSIMMGAIKTGNEIDIKYNFVVKTPNYQTKN